MQAFIPHPPHPQFNASVSGKMPRKSKVDLKHKEQGFDLSRNNDTKLASYSALRDPNLRHFFENRKLQDHLYGSGMIDKAGRVIDVDKNKAKLSIIEQEFAHAEKSEYWRQKEEEEMRRRVQLKRHHMLDQVRRDDKLIKMKEDRKIRQEIVNASRDAGMAPSFSNSTLSRTGGMGSSKKLANVSSSTFLTDKSQDDALDLLARQY